MSDFWRFLSLSLCSIFFWVCLYIIRYKAGSFTASSFFYAFSALFPTFFRLHMTRMTTVQAGVMQIARLSSQLEVKNYGFVGTGQNPPYLCIQKREHRLHLSKWKQVFFAFGLHCLCIVNQTKHVLWLTDTNKNNKKVKHPQHPTAGCLTLSVGCPYWTAKGQKKINPKSSIKKFQKSIISKFQNNPSTNN